MKGFSIPNISIPKVSIPNISIPKSIGDLNVGNITSAIQSAVPDLSSLVKGLDIEGIASNFLSENMGDLELPSELSEITKLIK